MQVHSVNVSWGTTSKTSNVSLVRCNANNAQLNQITVFLAGLIDC